MRIFRSVLLIGFAVILLLIGGTAAYNAYRESQPPRFSAERFVRLCRPQLAAGIKTERQLREAGVARATGEYLRAKTPEDKAEKQKKMEDAQAALDDLRANGIYAKDGFLAVNADWFGRMDDASVVRTTLKGAANGSDAAAAVCMLNGKLAEVEGTLVGDEALDALPETVSLPLKKTEVRVAFQNGCGAVMDAAMSEDKLEDTVWMGACTFGLAHGKGLKQWNGTLTPATYFYGFDITPGEPHAYTEMGGASGEVSEIAARFKPLEEARLEKVRAMLAARTSPPSQEKGR